MFDFEWTGRSAGDESDRLRGIRAAEIYCRDHGYDAGEIWERCNIDDQSAWEQWSDIEGIAVHALVHGWHTLPENVSLIYRPQ